ncbi:unnamed protein product [Sphagnum balticum]
MKFDELLCDGRLGQFGRYQKCRLDENDTLFETNYSSIPWAYRGDGQCGRVNVRTGVRTDCTDGGYVWSEEKTSALQQRSYNRCSIAAPPLVRYCPVGRRTSVELTGPSRRQLTGNIIELFFTFGTVLLGVMAYAIRNWQHLQLAVSLPGLAFLSYYWILPESPRWLLSVNRRDEAISIIRTMARVNRVELKEEWIQALNELIGLLFEIRSNSKSLPSSLPRVPHSSNESTHYTNGSIFTEWYNLNCTRFHSHRFVVSIAFPVPTRIFRLVHRHHHSSDVRQRSRHSRLLCHLLARHRMLLHTHPLDSRWPIGHVLTVWRYRVTVCEHVFGETTQDTDETHVVGSGHNISKQHASRIRVVVSDLGRLHVTVARDY